MEELVKQTFETREKIPSFSWGTGQRGVPGGDRHAPPTLLADSK